jgi:hypothetical protein
MIAALVLAMACAAEADRVDSVDLVVAAASWVGLNLASFVNACINELGD